jgi:guanine nucleotide-binding protein subunit alpha
MLGITSSSSTLATQVDRGKLLKADAADLEKVEEASDLLTACQDDIITLWSDQAVKDVLKKRDVRLEESPGL